MFGGGGGGGGGGGRSVARDFIVLKPTNKMRVKRYLTYIYCSKNDKGQDLTYIPFIQHIV